MKGLRVILAIGVIAAILVSVAAYFASPKQVTFYVYDASAKPPWAGGPSDGDDGAQGYEILAKWDLPVDVYYNPSGPYGLSGADIETTISTAIGEWDGYTSADLIRTIESKSDADFDSSMDGYNEVSFGDYSENGVIAVCRMWITRGKPSSRRIVEFDLLFDTDFTWGNADPDNDGTIDDTTIMDLQNIATHELGHGIIGLGDIYDTQFSEITMYGYASYGEIKKRSIEDPDKAGLLANYGR